MPRLWVASGISIVLVFGAGAGLTTKVRVFVAAAAPLTAVSETT